MSAWWWRAASSCTLSRARAHASNATTASNGAAVLWGFTVMRGESPNLVNTRSNESSLRRFLQLLSRDRSRYDPHLAGRQIIGTRLFTFWRERRFAKTPQSQPPGRMGASPIRIALPRKREKLVGGRRKGQLRRSGIFSPGRNSNCRVWRRIDLVGTAIERQNQETERERSQPEHHA